MVKCEKCGMNLADNCIIVWKCPSCGKVFKVSLEKLRKIQEQRHKTIGKNILKCSDCGHALDDGNEEITCKCSTCGNIIVGNLEYFVGENFSFTQSTENVRSGFIKCPECGKEIKDTETSCPECGYSFIEHEKKKDVNNQSRTDGLRSMRTMVIILAVICFIVSGVFFAKSHNVKNEYYNSDYSLLNKNAYVGGDAYNYIINGTYFTGYSVIASAFFLGGLILFSNSMLITIKMREYGVVGE